MELRQICIYEYIKDYLNEIAVINYKKGQYIARSDEKFTEIFFILSGNVKVECITEYGKSFLVDELSENEFVGKISYLYEQHLYCDIKATSNVALLKIHKETFDKLQKKPEFLKIFLFKTSNRIYYMYKKLMMKNLFDLEELFAFYLLKQAEQDIFKFKNASDLCNLFPISRKGLYNVMNKLIRKGAIQREKNSIIIADKKQLTELSLHVREFNQTNSGNIKFEL